MKILKTDQTADPIPRETRFESISHPDAPSCPVELDWRPLAEPDSFAVFERRVKILAGIYIVAQIVWLIATVYGNSK